MARDVAANLVIKLAADIGTMQAELRKAQRVADRRLKSIEKRAKRTERSFEGLGRGARMMGRAVAAALAAFGVRQLVQTADAYKLIGSRLQLVTRGANDLAAAQERLFQISQRTRQDFLATAELFQRVALGRDQLGRSTEELLQFTEQIQKLVLISGASAQEAKAAIIQLAQGLASGELRGEELRSVMEQLPAVAMTIADAMGVSIGTFREMAHEGQVTADTVIDAILGATDETNRAFDGMEATVGQSLTQIGNSFGRMIDSMESRFGIFARFSQGFQDLAYNLSRIFSPTNIQRVSAWGNEMLANSAAVSELQGELRELELSASAVSQGQAEAARQRIVALEQRNSTLSHLIQGATGALDDQAAAASRATQPLGTMAETYERIERAAVDAVPAVQELSDAVVIRAQEFTRAQEGMEKTLTAIKDTAKGATDEMSVYAEQGARNMQDAFADFLFDPFSDGVNGMLRNFLNILRRMIAEAAAARFFESSGLNGLFSGMFGGGGGGGKPDGRAIGGPVTAGTPFMVGERGPELFVPNVSGKVVPNGRAGVSVQMTNNFSGGVSRAELEAYTPTLVEMTKSAVGDAMRRRDL